MKEETIEQTDENVGNSQEIKGKERIETSEGFLWTVTLEIRDAKGRAFTGIGVCKSNELEAKMSESSVLTIARDRARDDAMMQAELHYNPIKEKEWDRIRLPPEQNAAIVRSVTESYDMQYTVKTPTDTFPDELQKDVLRDICKNIHDEKLSVECTVPDQSETYGEGSAGLTWIFHNRLLPVKFILRTIAEQIIADKKQFVDFQVAKESVRSGLENFTNYLREIDRFSNTAKHGKYKQGFPHTKETARLSPKLKKFVDRKTGEFKAREGTKTREAAEAICDRLVNTSTNRFIDQFFGRQDKSKSSETNVTFVGACFEMELLFANTKLEVTLTQKGLDFVCLQNPVLRSLKLGDRTPSRILSKIEVLFFMENIVSQERFGLERKIMKKMLGSKPPLLVEDIVQILKDEQKDYMKKKGIGMERDLQENLDKYRQMRAITTASRLVEMRLLEKGSSDNETEGLPPRTSYAITEFGEQIYEDIFQRIRS